MSRSVPVGLGARAYEVVIGPGLLAEAGRRIAPFTRRGRLAVVSDETVWRLHGAALAAALEGAGLLVFPVIVQPGEQTKSFEGLADVTDRLLALELDRGDLVAAFGGGVVGDLTGFAAAIYKRGIDFVQIPTTLLAQVDSSVGGKTGINHPLGKNMIGAFYQPRAVLIDTDCLATLPDRELSAGLAEVVKYGAIRDRAFFDWLEANVDALLARDPVALKHAIRVSCAIKAAVVAVDERETGERALLNFGHTFGHAIETATGYGTWLHGEAIAARLSQRTLDFPAGDVARLSALLAYARLPIAPPEMAYPRWRELLARDKKVTTGALRFVLLTALGAAVISSEIEERELSALLS